tara:strand:- start:669 stop:1499 length:831 start_codon:yes stop_codon:yes gene_type:complete
MAEREAGMMTCSGLQGVGKTYQNMHIIKEYVKDKIYNKVRGRQCLIFDTNGEYTLEQFTKNDIPDFTPKRIAINDVEDWCRMGNAECRRIDAKNLSIAEKKAAVEFLMKVYRNGMLVLEDINTYILSLTHMEDIVGGLVNLRHRAVDVLISYQSLRPVEPRIWQNSRWVRMHYQADNVNDIKGKLPNPTLFKLAQILVNNRYHSGDKRFFVYIFNFQNKIEGNFTKKEFMDACTQYLNSNKKYIKEYKEMHNTSMEESLGGQAKQYFELYYGNGKK